MTDREIPVCPNCDSHRIHVRQSQRPESHIAATGSWHCQDCEQRHDDIVWRAPRSDYSLSGLAAELAATDADEVFVDG